MAKPGGRPTTAIVRDNDAIRPTTTATPRRPHTSGSRPGPAFGSSTGYVRSKIPRLIRRSPIIEAALANIHENIFGVAHLPPSPPPLPPGYVPPPHLLESSPSTFDEDLRNFLQEIENNTCDGGARSESSCGASKRRTKPANQRKKRGSDGGGSKNPRSSIEGFNPPFPFTPDVGLESKLDVALMMGRLFSKEWSFGQVETPQPQFQYEKKKPQVMKRKRQCLPPRWTDFVLDDLLCDCLIESNDGKVFRAHRTILLSSVPSFYDCYFKRPKVNPKGPQPKVEKCERVSLKTVNSRSLNCILEYAYTGDFLKSPSIVVDLMATVKRYRMIEMLQKCCRYLIQIMSPENSLRIFSFCRQYFCARLEAKAKYYILHNFRKIVKTRDYLELTPERLKFFLKEDHLNIRNEAAVFDAIRTWVEQSPGLRKRYVPELLTCIRFGLMSYGYFTNVVVPWRPVQEEAAIRRALEAPSVFMSSIDSLRNADVDLNDPLARPRVPYEVVFAVGGWSAGSPTSFTETYDLRADRWFLLNNSDTTPRAYHGLVSFDKFIYMIGGFDGQEHFNTVKRYNPTTHIWEERACMLFPRCYVSCCELDGLIYACGGYNGRSRMTSAEKYTPSRNQWEMIGSMNRPRSDASAASLEGKIYIAGGFTGTEVLNTVEVYDPEDDQWTFMQALNTARSGLSLVTYRDHIYAMGGFNGFTRLRSGERFEPDENTGSWQMIPEMAHPRSNFAAVSADGLLICMGGFNGTTTIPYVECYDSKVNDWFDASHMNLNRSALSACVVAHLPNAREYSYLYRIQALLGLPIEPIEMDMDIHSNN